MNLYTRHIIHITNPNPAREIIFFYDIIVIFSVSYILLVIEKSYPSNKIFIEIETIYQLLITLDEDYQI